MPRRSPGDERDRLTQWIRERALREEGREQGRIEGRHESYASKDFVWKITASAVFAVIAVIFGALTVSWGAIRAFVERSITTETPPMP